MSFLLFHVVVFALFCCFFVVVFLLLRAGLVLDKSSIDSEMSSTVASEVAADASEMSSSSTSFSSLVVPADSNAESIISASFSLSLTNSINLIPSFWWKENHVSRIFRCQNQIGCFCQCCNSIVTRLADKWNVVALTFNLSIVGYSRKNY